MSLFAPPEYFAALAAAAENDDDLQRGTHVRVMPSPALGFPLTPIGLYRVRVEVATPQVQWHDANDKPVADGNLDANGGLLFAAIVLPGGFEPGFEPVDIAVQVGGTFSGVAALIDEHVVGGQPREFCRVSQPPYLLGAPVVKRLRLEGRGVAQLTTWRVNVTTLLEQMLNGKPVALLSLPIAGGRAWYAGGLGPANAMQQVEQGAPLRLTPADRPDGPLDALTPDQERQRMAPQAADIDAACERLLGDAAVRPGSVRLAASALPAGQVKQHSVDMSQQNLLLMQSLDPGAARYLGLMTRIDDLPAAGEPVAWVALAMLALQLDPLRPTLFNQLGDQPALLQRVVDHHLQTVEAQSGRSGEYLKLAGAIANRPGGATRPLLAVCAAVPPADRPLVAAPALDPKLGRRIGRPAEAANAFRQGMTWPLAPLGGLLALGRLEADGWQTRHLPAPLAADADSPPRVLPLLLGRTSERPPQASRGLLSDAPIPADPGAPPRLWRYRVALADLFGRFGAPAEFDIGPPPRPKPPTPAPQIDVVLDGPSGNEAGTLPPGHVDVTVPVPNVADLPAGSLPLLRLHLGFDGAAPIDIDLVPEVLPDPAAPRSVPVVSARIELPPLDVAQQASGTLTARFEDSAGAGSAVPASLAVAYADRRPLPVIPSGLGLIWTSRPGPAPEVEVKLGWPAPPGAKYRAFIADAFGLGLAAGPRANQAVEAGQRARAKTLGARERFRLLGDVAEAGGRCKLDEGLPRSLASVQVLRFVPLTANGREAPFDDCPVVPIAVPGERRPPAARITSRIDAGSGRATLRIEADGFDWVALQAAEPGLFTSPPAADARPPEFRLRRATGAVPEPLYAREIARGTLAIEPVGTSFRAVAEFEETEPLTPYVNVAWWAEVRFGAERRVQAGFEEIPPEGGTQALVAAQMQDLPQPFSLPSAPATAMRILPLLPAPEGAVASLLEAGGNRQISLQIAAPLAAAPKVTPPYRLRVWEQWGEAPMVSAGPDIDLGGAALSWTGTSRPVDPADLPAALLVAYVDPLGRMGTIARLAVA